MAGLNPNTFGFTGNDPTGFVEQEATSSLDSWGKKSMSTEWTDEKHSLYLKSMEASFVDQLHHSIDLLGWKQQNKHHLAMRSSMHLNSRTSGQFKVHQYGSWQRINFERAEPVEEAAGNHILLENPWIRHFRAGCRKDVQFTAHEENIASGSQLVSYGKKKELARGLANISKQSNVCLHHQYPLNSSEEVSDQNFIDDDDEEGEDDVHRTKRSKSVKYAASSKAQ
ncbi:hypothetical protein Nepgr_018509 [Nepenthes gracilis]|uniref:Uncharacterized protein n=1 Tax=Nepenthes gracilis TaxID=150966 RepID=A0AAD3SRH8_NEPGR|nr:hypothetical protein Nepgr_018509 [Nepenthes gracilis]